MLGLDKGGKMRIEETTFTLIQALTLFSLFCDLRF